MCKFYQGVDEKKLEAKLNELFHEVHREKPESSRKVGSSWSLSHDNQTDETEGISGAVFCGAQVEDGSD